MNNQTVEVLNPMERANDDLLSLVKDKHILIAVDESESSKRAVLYVADFLGGSPGFRVTVVSFILIPEDDYFREEEERAEWVERKRVEAGNMLGKYQKILIGSGFPEEKIFGKAVVKDCHSIAECIIEEQQKLGSCTVVVGRRKISRKEEFLFGSTSNKLLHMPKNCSVWIIE